MARGGARVGAGRKPKTEQGLCASGDRIYAHGHGWRSPRDGIKRGIKQPRVVGDSARESPPEQRDFWHRYAARALELGTLTVDTVAAFRLLCELDAEKVAVKQTIDRDGRTYIKVTIDGAGQEHQELNTHPLKGDYRQLSQRVEALMGRFMLAPFGKPPTPTRKRNSQATANPWAAIAAKR